MSFLSFLNPVPDKISIVLDIGSSSVGGALVLLNPGGKPRIIFTYRERLPYSDDRPTSRLSELLVQTIERVAKAMDEWGAAHREVHHIRLDNYPVYCVFSSPWFIAKTKIFTVEKQKPFSIDKGFINTILKNEEELFGRTTSTDIKADVKIIEHALVQVKLNGYETALPFGKEVRSAELAMFMSLVPKDLFDRAAKAIATYFSRKRVSFNSFSLLFLSVVRDIFVSETDFVLLNISGEMTDISIAKKGVILETVSLPLGKNFLVRRVSENMNLTPQLASSMIKLYAEGKVHNETTQKIETILRGAETEWLKLFEQALLHFSEAIFLPKTMFLTVNNDLATFFLKAIENEEYSQFTITNEPFRVILLNADKIGAYCDFDDAVTRDSFLGVESVFFNNLARK